EAEGDRGLAIAGWAVEQHSSAGIQRWTDLLDEAIGDRQVAEGLLDPVPGDDLIGDFLNMHPFGESIDGDGRRTGILRLLQSLHRPMASLVRDRVVHVGKQAVVTSKRP